MRWEQQGNLSSHWTTVLHSNSFLVILLAVTTVHLGLIFHIPLTTDELYYWAWAKTPQWSYFDHPPMVAYLIGLSSAVFGDNAFGIRFFAWVFSFVVLLLVRSIYKNASILTLVLFTPVVFLGAILMTPDVPLLFFWALYLIWAIRLNDQFAHWHGDPIMRVYRSSPISIWRWITGGIIFGLGLLSKYTMFLGAGCLFLLLVIHYRNKSFFVGYVVHLITAAIVASPILIYNMQHDFAPLQFQWSHSMGAGGLSIDHWLEFMGGQALLVGLLPFLVLPFILFLRSRICSAGSLQTCFFFSVPLLLFFIFQSFRTKLEGNWALISYLGLWPICQAFFDYNSFKLLTRLIIGISFAPALAVTLLVSIHSFTPLPMIPPEKDRLGEFRAERELAQQIAAESKRLAQPIFAPSYQWTAQLRFAGATTYQITPHSRPSHFTMEPKDFCSTKNALLLTPPNKVPPLECPIRELKTFSLDVRGSHRATLSLYTNAPAAPAEPET